jgi:hypothetical protein
MPDAAPIYSSPLPHDQHATRSALLIVVLHGGARRAAAGAPPPRVDRLTLASGALVLS